MNLKRTIINTCIAASAMLYTSCELDLVPLDYYGSGSYWKTVPQVESYMNGIHVDLRASNFNRQFLLGEARGGTSKSGTSSLITSINYDRIKENNLDADNTGISGWNNIYGYIFDCNLLIQEVEGTALQSENASTINYLLDQDIRNALENNGISIPYHFTVATNDGREVYRCPDYEEKGKDYSYSQVLFRNDPAGKIGIVRIHFPDMNSYLLETARMMIPALAFTIILFVTFVFTIYVIFRQKKVTEMKNDFINNMTHEFKTPISSISLAAQMLSDQSIKKSEAMYENLSRVINDETKRLRFQVEKVLQMSLYDRDNIAFKQKELDAHQLLAGVIKTFTLKVSQNGGSISSDFKAEQAEIYVDEMHFTNVIFNLMDNAVKYKRDDVELHLTLRTWNTGDKINISIEDNGIGIQKDDLKRIFDKFYRVHTGNKHDVKGFGLGLAYVKKIVGLQNGVIHAESEYGHGTKFIITLPTIKK